MDLNVPMIFGVFASGDRLFCTGKLDHSDHSLSHDHNQTKIVTTANTINTL